MFNAILVVCAGNICRSPTAEQLLKNKLADNDITVSSAGLKALVGKSADARAATIALRNNIDMSAHKARQLSSSFITGNDLILVMEQRHLNDLCDQYPNVRGKVFLLGKWLNDAEISDPYRQSDEAFEHVYQLIDKCCDAWAKYL
ncbi:low molecular weight protein-tyrosine-phosphatase [Paraglaciecola psychrophila]|nr:low molecular weight protein-tyrosine-phosphatase [Paraglaciecola psychrophila]